MLKPLRGLGKLHLFFGSMHATKRIAFSTLIDWRRKKLQFISICLVAAAAATDSAASM
jgi:hypothetical protein